MISMCPSSTRPSRSEISTGLLAEHAQLADVDWGGVDELDAQRSGPTVDGRSGVHRPAAGEVRHGGAGAGRAARHRPLSGRVDRDLARRQAYPRGRACHARWACERDFRTIRLGVLRHESRMVAGQGNNRRRRADHDGISHLPIRLRWARPVIPDCDHRVRRRVRQCHLRSTGPHRRGTPCRGRSTDGLAMARRARVDPAPYGSDARWRTADHA